MAHKKAGGSSRNGRDSQSKRLGVKAAGGSYVRAGNIIIRQKGSNFFAGSNVSTGNDYTLFSLIDGTVEFVERRRTRFDGQKHVRKFVNVLALAAN